MREPARESNLGGVPPHPLRRALPLLALLLVTTLAFARLYAAQFSWDDEALVRDNQWTGSLSQIPELFRRDLWSTTRLSSLESGYYRPLFLVSLAVDRALFGLSPAGAHAVSLAWHLAAVAALYGLTQRLLGRDQALLAATIFALHPAQSEVLALVAARNDSMAAALTLGALTLLVEREARPRALVGAGLLSFAAMLSKESGVLAMLMLLALDLGRWGRPGPARRYAPLALALLAYVGLRASVGVGSAISSGATGVQALISNLPGLLATYGSLLVWPWPLSPARHIHYLPPLHETLPGLLALLGLLGVGLARAERRGLALAALAWSALSFAPTLAATLDKGLLGERYLYFPIAGLGLFAASALASPPRWLAPALAAPAILALQLRLPDWQDSRTVWEAAHRSAPSPFTAAGLGWYLHRDGELDRAMPLLVEALEGEPPYLDACGLVVLAHLEAKKAAEAARIGLWALQRGCAPEGEISNQTALALASVGRWDEAVKLARDRPGGAAGTGVVVIAAAWARTGRLDAVTALAPRVPGPPAFSARVAKLLSLAGEPAAAAAVAALDSPETSP